MHDLLGFVGVEPDALVTFGSSVRPHVSASSDFDLSQLLEPFDEPADLFFAQVPRARRISVVAAGDATEVTATRRLQAAQRAPSDARSRVRAPKRAGAAHPPTESGGRSRCRSRTKVSDPPVETARGASYPAPSGRP